MKEKRSFLTNVVALFLCLSMLLGSTYSWFTDFATSKDNVIQSGVLDVEMYWSDTLLAADSSEWKDADGVPLFTDGNWEPGYTEVKYIKLKNAGNLSFKWKLNIEATGEIGKLAEVIDVYCVNPVETALTRSSLTAGHRAGVLSETVGDDIANGVILPADKASTEYSVGDTILAIAFRMQEEAGNEYMGKSIGDGFSINVVATQFNYESGSFGDEYDANIEWPSLDTIIGNSASAPVDTTADNKVAAAVNLLSEDNKISASIPTGVQLASGVDTLTLTVADVENSKANVTLSETEAALSIDVHVKGVAKTNTVIMAISIKELLPVGLNMGNYRFYHVENGATVEMTLLADGATPVHNNYEYDPATGDVVLHLASFSEVALVADTENAWEGNFDYSWYTGAVAPVDGESVTEYTIANADQLAAFGAIVGGMAEGIEQDSFKDKTVKLIANINLGDAEANNNPDLIFYPIGYNSSDGKYEKTGEAVTTGFYNFCGTFDGNGNTIANFYHNTWEMKGDNNYYDATLQYYRDGMGLFGKIYGGTVKNLTVKNFSSDGEYTTTGVIAAYADGATFENIAIFDCTPRVYNIGNGGIVGCVGWYAKEANLKTTFKNITVDNSNKISALWGSYDVACGGIVGQYYPTSGQSSAGTPANGGVSFENCHISAQMDVYNDVCGNYQYYAYRYAGMLIGSVRENVTIDGNVYPKMDGITATKCTVHFGTWNDYYYCEFEKNGHPSYSGPDDYKFSRIPHSEINFTDSNGNGIIDTDEERDSVTGCKHEHTTAENNQAIRLPFNNLVTGYGWGVTTKVVGELEGVTILDRVVGDSVVKFEGKVNELISGKTYTLGEIFNLVNNGVELIPSAIAVGITNLDENNPVSTEIGYNTTEWENTTITFTGAGRITITIQDYYFCTPTTITVEVKEHTCAYDNKCDAVCDECGATRDVSEHVYDNNCDVDCNECGIKREEINGHIYDNACDTTCNECGLNREPTHTAGASATCTTAQTCTVCKETLVAALGHTEVTDVAKAPTCTEDGLTEGSHCSVCNEVLVAQETVAAKGHTVVTDAAVAATCTESGLTKGEHCSVCNEILVAQATIDAFGHITTNFTGDFLYRVGNQNDVQLSSLFNVGKRNVTISGENVAGNASVAVNSTILTFSGTGVVKVTLSSDCTCNECELELTLEVVDATNLTSASGTTTGGTFVLLCDVNTSTYVNYWNCTLYGNGFTYSLKGAPTAYNSKQGHGVIITKNATIDNLVVIGDVYDSYGAYTNQDDYNGAFDATSTTFTNCYIANCATPIRANGVTIKDTTLYGGTVANIIISGGVNTFENVTTVNYNDGRGVVGFGIVISDGANDNTKLILNGTLKQYNFVAENDKSIIKDDNAATLFETMFGNTYSQYHITKDKVKYVNTGVLSMTDTFDSSDITDNTDNGYIGQTISYKVMVNTYNGYLYTISGSGNSVDNGYIRENDVKQQGDYLPKFEFNLGDYFDANDGENDTRYCYESVDDEEVRLLYQDGQNAFVFDLTKLVSVTKFGYSLDATVVCKNSSGVILATDSVITLKDAGMYTFEITVIDDIIYGQDGKLTGESVSRVYTIKVELSVKKSSWKNAEITMKSATNKSGYNSSKYYVLVFLESISITDYAEDGTEEVVNLKAEYESYEISYVNESSYAWAGFTLKINYKDGRVLTVTFGAPSGLSSPGASAGGKTISLKNDNTYGYVLQSDGKINTKVSGTWSITKCTYKGANTVTVECTNTIELNVDKNTTINVNSGSSSGGGECVTPDTMITLADGTQVRVDSLTGKEELLVWNMETGKLDKAPIMFLDNDAETEFEVIKLKFSDGTEVKVIGEHGFWDYDLNKYVYLDENAADYIGHTFAKQNGDSLEKVQLVDVVIENEVTTAWSPVTVGHLCYFVNGMLSMPGGVGGLFNIFEVDAETMTYDYEQIEKDIETYGLFTYEELNAICPLSEDMFNAAGGAYLKISIGKGNLTMEELINMINRYSKYI